MPQKIKEEKLRDRMEGIIHAYAVNHYNAKERDWVERRRVRNVALDDLEELFSQEKQKAYQEGFAKAIELEKFAIKKVVKTKRKK